LRHNLQEDVEWTVQDNIQKIIDSQMAKVEQAIHKTLQKGDKEIATQSKREMTERKSDKTFEEAATHLDHSMMRIGKEMDTAVKEFNAALTDPQERTRLIDRLQQRAMKEI
jgi:hypothetical protein